MSRSVIPLALPLALAVAASPALVRSAAAAQVDSRLERAMAALPAAAARDLERAVASAGSQGLPTDPLVDKALEGSAKGVSADRVLAVVRQLAEDLGRARGLLGEADAAAPADITAVADALRRGVPENAVRTLRATAPGDETIALAVHTLADLLDRGVPVDDALDVLGAWRSQGARPDELRELPAAVERLIREGILPAHAAAAVSSAVRAGHGPGSAGGSPGARGKGKGKGPPLAPGADPPGQGKGKSKGKGKKPGGG